MQPAIRQLPAVLLSALIVWLVLNQSYIFRTPWWGFLLMLACVFLVVDYALRLLYQKLGIAERP